jgi:RNA polymerase sigma-70 factor (ECF subfamily)
MGDRHSDAQLLKSVAAGDMTACRTLVDGYANLMLGLAYQMLRDVTEAEDVSQEAFLRLWKQSPKWKPEAKISVWLYRVTYNLCIDRLRKTKEIPDEGIPERTEQPSQLEDIHNGEVAEVLNNAVFSLPERQRAAITIVHLQEQTNIAAAEIMGVSIEALESLLARGRKGLKKHLRGKREDLIGGL